MPPTSPIRVLLADDHSVVAEGVRAILSREFEVLGVARNGRDLLKLALDLRPDVIIADIAMPAPDGIEATSRLAADLPHCPVIILSGHDSPTYIRAALRAGAKGYVLKAKAEELPTAIRTVLRGKPYLPATFALPPCGQPGNGASNPLTPREQEILQLFAAGKVGKEIAALVGVSVRTIEFHKYNIMNKLSLRTMADLMRYAIQQGYAPNY